MKINPGSRLWKNRAIELALSYAPNIYPCGKCNNPVADGYVCSFCNDSNPNRDKEGRRVEAQGWV